MSNLNILNEKFDCLSSVDENYFSDFQDFIKSTF
ncbi:MAG: hypothetical protein ACI93L_003769, partial [Cyclobacteriaceae bacterium]